MFFATCIIILIFVKMHFSMIKIRLTMLAVMLMCSFANAGAQHSELMLRLKAGDSASHGAFGAAALILSHQSESGLALSGGAQYSSIGSVACELRPSYSFDTDICSLGAEALLHYGSQAYVGNYALGAGVLLSMKALHARLGYFYRSFYGRESCVSEPFNIYYELSVNILERSDDWDLYLSFTNAEFLQLERHYQPSYLLQGCWHGLERMSFRLGLGYKPAGMFNMSSDYYQLSADIGICYRW